MHEIEAIVGKIASDQSICSFIQLMRENVGILTKMRTEAMDDARTWSFIADNATFARLTQRVNDNQDFEEVEIVAVNNLGTVHDLVTLVTFHKHDSVQSFFESIQGRGEITSKELTTLSHIERTIQLVARVFQDASTSADARDNQLLDEVATTGVWVCTEPTGLRGDGWRLSEQVISLQTETKRFSLAEAEDLRDRYVCHALLQCNHASDALLQWQVLP